MPVFYLYQGQNTINEIDQIFNNLTPNLMGGGGDNSNLSVDNLSGFSR